MILGGVLELKVRQVYAPTQDAIGYEAGSGPDARTMLIMGVTLAAFAGVAHQAFQAAPVPTIAAPEGPIKVRVDQAKAESAFASSLIYQPLRGEAINEDVHFRPEPERLVSAIPLSAIPLAAPAAEEDWQSAQDGAVFAPEADGPRHRVQFGAVLTQVAAKALWMAVLERSPGELADARLEIGRVVDKQGRNLYTVQTAPLTDKAEADELCARLRAAGESCLATFR